MTLTHVNNGETAASRLLTELDALEPMPACLDADRVHRIRVAIKQTRAWLKLLRGATGKTPDHQRVHEDLRDLSVSLSAQRDHDVALLTLAKLASKYPGKKASRLIDALQQELAQHPPALPDVHALNSVKQEIRQALLPFMQQVVDAATQREVVSRTYAKMCKASKVALTSETCADLHAWRKLVKALGYQLAMIPFARPRHKKQIRHLTKLGSKLGDVHDLCFLQIMTEDTQLTRKFDMTPLLKRIELEFKAQLGAVRKHAQYVCDLALEFTEMKESDRGS